MLSLTINGEEHIVKCKNLKHVMDELKKDSTPVAVAVNEQFIPKTNYHLIELNEGDQLELLSPMQGG